MVGLYSFHPKRFSVIPESHGECAWFGNQWRKVNDKALATITPEAESVADELFQDRIVEAIGDTVQAAIRDHKRAGNPIAEWRDGRVVVVPPEEIED